MQLQVAPFLRGQNQGSCQNVDTISPLLATQKLNDLPTKTLVSAVRSSAEDLLPTLRAACDVGTAKADTLLTSLAVH
jgi:hypothetical protein